MKNTLITGLLICIFHFSTLIGVANNIGDLNNSIPEFSVLQPIEPTTASLGRYGEFQMDYSRGLPNIMIPLYEIKSGDLTIPLTLSYQGGGIRVNQEATWVGLGWDLFYGGQITRTIHGFPDEIEAPAEERPTAAEISEYIMQHNTEINNIYLRDLSSEKLSSYTFQPDEYYYNMGTESGKFIGGQVEAMLPHNPVFISQPGKFGMKWEVKNSNGESYFFKEEEITSDLTESHKYAPYTSAWYIAKVISPDNHVVRYEYQYDGRYIDDSSSYYEGYSYERDGYGSITGSTQIPLRRQSSTKAVESKKPLYIYFNGGRVKFTLSDRLDIHNSTPFPNPTPIKKLDYITIEELNSDQVYVPFKNIFFEYFYKEDRLMLNRLYEVNAKDSSMKLIAKFEYDMTPLPAKNSFSYDYCGYNNGATSNQTPVPLYNITLPNRKITLGGANKNVVESCTKASTLLSIEYPTGGKTKFTWENHRYGAESPLYTGQYAAIESVDLRNEGVGMDCSNQFPRDTEGGAEDPNILRIR